MPLMMEDDLDDLFGDAPQLQLPASLPKGLLQRLDEACLSGCRQRLAWSKNGCIVHISSDSCDVVLQHLLCDPSNGQWGLSKQYVLDEVRNIHREGELVHLSWNHTGNELAVFDIFGRMSIYAVMVTTNRVSALRRCSVDPEDSLGAVVGAMWLHTDRMNSYFYKPMTKNNNEWSFSCTQQKSMGPRSPGQRPALLMITRHGMLKVLFQGQDRWNDIKIDTESVTSPSEMLTHAAMCADKGADKDSLLLVTHSNDRELRTYRITIDFEHLKIHLQVMKHVSNISPADQEFGSTTASQNILPSNAKLSFLDIVPPGPDSRTREPTQPFVLAVFSYLADEFQAGGEQSTVICRWELQAVNPELHSCFNTLLSRDPSASSPADLPAEYLLRRSSDLMVPRSLLSVQQINASTVLAMIYSDGLVEFRDRTTMDVLPPDGSGQISSLHQIGFAFLDSTPRVHIALSPNACALCFLDEDNASRLNLLQYGREQLNSLVNEGFFETANEAFVMQCSYASMTPLNQTDDVLAMIQIFSNQYLAEVETATSLANRDAFNTNLVSEIYRIFGVKIDHSMDEHLDQAVKIGTVQRCSSIQASLGYSGYLSRRSLASLVAWTMLNARYISVIFAMACNRRPNSQSGATENELKNLEMVQCVVAFVSWFLALMSFIMDEIFVLGDALEDEDPTLNSLDSASFNQKIRSSNSPTFPLLFISISRAILRYNCRYITVLMNESSKHASSTPLGRAYRELDMILQKSPIQISHCERLLSQIDSSVKTAYQSSGLSDAERKSVERTMLVRAEIPAALMEPVKQLLTTTADLLRENINVAELYFTNVSWLGLTDDESTKRSAKQHPIDAMRKVEMRKGVKKRRCIRCGAIMEDVVAQRGSSMLLFNLQRFCLCGSSWMALDGSEVSALEG